MKSFLYSVTICFALLVMAESPAFAGGDHNSPHEHRGLLKPYTGAPPQLSLTPADKAKLEKGLPVRKQLKNKAQKGGRGIVIQDIDAPPSVVMGRILDFNNYPNMVDKVKLTKNYAVQGNHIKTRFIIGTFAFSIEYFIDHSVNKEKGYVTWTLDYDRSSELDDSVGFWYVAKHPTKPNWTRLYYSVEIRVASWVPSFVENYLSKEGLVTATAGEKRIRKT